MHRVIEPKIMYLGTSVILISRLNEDDTPNLAPMSSAWWLKKSCLLGLANPARHLKIWNTTENLPSSELVATVDCLALTTGKNRLPEYKQKMNFEFVKDHRFSPA